MAIGFYKNMSSTTNSRYEYDLRHMFLSLRCGAHLLSIEAAVWTTSVELLLLISSLGVLIVALGLAILLLRQRRCAAVHSALLLLGLIWLLLLTAVDGT